MADVSCGANTPSMVKKVTAWRKADAEAEELWTQYSLASAALQDALADLCALHSRIAAERAVEERWAAPLRRCRRPPAREPIPVDSRRFRSRPLRASTVRPAPCLAHARVHLTGCLSSRALLPGRQLRRAAHGGVGRGGRRRPFPRAHPQALPGYAQAAARDQQARRHAD